MTYNKDNSNSVKIENYDLNLSNEYYINNIDNIFNYNFNNSIPYHNHNDLVKNVLCINNGKTNGEFTYKNSFNV